MYDKMNVLEFMQNQLERNKEQRVHYHPLSQNVLVLSDIFDKDVGYVIVMRQLHQFLAEIGLEINLNRWRNKEYKSEIREIEKISSFRI